MATLLLARRLWPGLLLGLLARPAQAQNAPITFGQLEAQYLTAAPFATDTAAEAVVLCDYGKTTIIREDAEKHQLRFERITRIKILKKSGFDWAKVEVQLRHDGAEYTERILNVQGLTYNLVDGKIVQEKLQVSNAFLDKISDQHSLYKFALPNVREGSVIEFSYAILSDFTWQLYPWQFQTTIPVRWSEYRAVIPHHFNYKMFIQRTQPLAIEQRSNAQDLMPRYRWAMKDVPALRREPYMTTPADYVDELTFELADYGTTSLTRSWEQIDAVLLQHPDFGQQLSQTGFLKAEIAKLPPASASNVQQRLAAVHNLIITAVKCVGQPHLLASAPLRKVYQEAHRGTPTDVNLLLVAALRAAGFVANPVLLSTRDHGRLRATIPQLTQFNYVVAHVKLPDGEELLLDATDPLLPYDLLPERCLNQQARLLGATAGSSRWLEIKPRQRHIRLQQVQLRVTPEGEFNGTMHEEHAGYAGAESRTELQQMGEKKFVYQLNSQHPTVAVSGLTISNRDSVHRPLAVDYTFTQPAEHKGPLDIIYLSPLRDFGLTHNPFRAETRLYPVDFGTPQEQTLFVTLTLPAGYTLVAVPKSKAVDLPDNGGRFVCSTTVAGATVQLTSRLTLRKAIYSAAEYAQLRELYRLLLEKQAEQLELKKQG